MSEQDEGGSDGFQKDCDCEKKTGALLYDYDY